MPRRRIAIVCPDLNIELSVDRLSTAATGGGKAALMQLAFALARSGSEVTIAAAASKPGSSGRLHIVKLAEAEGKFDAAIFVTGSRGNFENSVPDGISAGRRVFWVNAPQQVTPPPGPIDVFVLPSRFLARTAIEDWGLPADRVVVIPGGAVIRRAPRAALVRRDRYRVVYASHPAKGLANAIEVLSPCVRYWPSIRLDVFGSERLWGDGEQAHVTEPDRPAWVRLLGEVPKLEVERRMSDYGLMIYLTEWIDSFSPVCSEAMAAGVIPIATAHGATGELIRHGWNGFLVGAPSGKPDLAAAIHLASTYFGDTDRFESMRKNAAASIPTWNEQAKEWISVIFGRTPASRP